MRTVVFELEIFVSVIVEAMREAPTLEGAIVLPPSGVATSVRK